MSWGSRPERKSLSRHGLVGLVLLGAVVALACVRGPARMDHFYRLQVDPPSSADSPPILDGVLVVDRFASDALLRGRPILFRRHEASSEIVPHAYRLWTDSPSLLVQAAVADHLRAAGVAQEVLVPAFDASPDWVLKGTLRRLEYVATRTGREAVVDLEVRVVRHPSRETLAIGRYHAERIAQDGDFEEVVKAFSLALGEALDSLHEDLRQAAMVRRPSP